jgi:uncharacterized membrane protein YhaH (DUF805 family)
MQDIEVHLQFWTYAMLYSIALWALFSARAIHGRAWLCAFLIGRYIVTGWNYVGQILLRSELLTTDQYRDFLVSGSRAISQPVNVLSYAALVGFLLVQRSPAGTRVGAKKLLFSFAGRLTRRPFWVVTLTLAAVNTYLAFALTSSPGPTVSDGWTMAPFGTYLLWLPVSVWISLATQVKRWHDRDKSGWWVLIGFVPVVGWAWSLVEAGFL